MIGSVYTSNGKVSACHHLGGESVGGGENRKDTNQ